jgi:uncharacterized protein (DUF697 family)
VLAVIVREVVQVGNAGGGFTWAIIPASIAAVGSMVAALITARSRRSLVRDVAPAVQDTQETVHKVDAAVQQQNGQANGSDG